MREVLAALLTQVSRPARYTGGEWNQVVKDRSGVQVSFAFAFPDVYEVGMSHLGLKVIYHLVNRRKDAVCERTFAPWVDMETLMRRNGVPLFTLETWTPVNRFDIVGFTLQYELTYTNIINMLDLAGIPLYSRDRGCRDPLVIAGGPCAFNPEPVADYMDCVLLGDAEDAIDEIIDAVRDWKCSDGGRPETRDRASLLRALSRVDGVYVPSFYEPSYDRDGRVRAIGLTASGEAAGVSRRVKKRVAALDLADYPLAPPVPFLDVVHDRAVVELFRGCTRGCRFCQAGMIYRPVRERSLEEVETAAREMIRNTGYEEVSLMSLSSTDYSAIERTVRDLAGELEREGVSLSLPSLRVDAFSVSLASDLHRVRKSGLTFAPEAGTQRLRDVINKQVTEEDVMEAAAAAFRSGWDALKLYFMIGLPTETDEDIEGIMRLAGKVRDLYGNLRPGKKPRLTVSASSFVPKPHTPFQWEGQAPPDDLEMKQRFLNAGLRRMGIHFDWHDVGMSRVEAVLARGDRRCGAAIVEAWRRGARFDSWSDRFDFARWMDAFRSCGLDPAFYANRPRGKDEVFPWDHIDAGVSRSFLWAERKRALRGLTTPDCRGGRCAGCGVREIADCGYGEGAGVRA